MSLHAWMYGALVLTSQAGIQAQPVEGSLGGAGRGSGDPYLCLSGGPPGRIQVSESSWLAGGEGTEVLRVDLQVAVGAVGNEAVRILFKLYLISRRKKHVETENQLRVPVEQTQNAHNT
eukprot:CAMPEP_0196661076 /NCGR_PEP_ID=MMETSP1086-20130531/42535_1 /TAXON_ID=77921 /ORGANISM="Cyanoptyche  gloeocystis , Strain SAG4.97" /LENGTH=118 /DNA_ID=CAMNT_0041995811 /DNA_START=138 /DNA_END=492 /DNA_ORIENTATION=+